jgi:uncharacterized protein (TIGR02597 family)
MKTKISYSLLAAAMACGMAQGQTTAYTTPVGYVTLGDTTIGQPSVKGNTDVLLTATLERPAVFAGLVSGVTGGVTIDIQGTPGLTASIVATPHVAKITSGSKAGFYALIASNDTDSVTVTLPTGQSLSGVVSGDKVEIRPAWTASSFFAGSNLPADTELYQFSGVSPGINVASDFIYVYDGTSWLDAGTGDPVDPVIYPGEQFVLRNVAAAPIPALVVSGEVPRLGVTNVITNFGPGQQDLPFGVLSPVNQTLAQAGLISVASADDELNIYDNSLAGINKAASILLVFDGVDWLDAGTGDPVGPAFSIKSGDGFVYRRAAGKPTVNWTSVPSYLPSL